MNPIMRRVMKLETHQNLAAIVVPSDSEVSAAREMTSRHIDLTLLLPLAKKGGWSTYVLTDDDKAFIAKCEGGEINRAYDVLRRFDGHHLGREPYEISIEKRKADAEAEAQEMLLILESNTRNPKADDGGTLHA
jgi:hypothetical protein